MADKKISALTAATTPLAGTEVLPIVQSASTVKVAVNDMLGVTSWTSPAVNSEGNMFLRATDTLGTGVGTQIGLGGKYNASSYFPFAAVAGRKENATNNNVAGYLAFLTTTSGGTLTERARFNSTGNLAFSTAGNGIDFSANTHAPGMTSELLNWYEEGTFTPTFTGFTVGNGTAFGFYRRIGKQVFVTYGFILGSTSSVGSLTGLSGLPFTTGTVGGSRFFNATGVAFKQGVGGFPAYGLLYSASTTGSGPASTNTNLGMNATAPFTWAADDSLSFTATYFVD
jgi:hypothetical protein